MEDPLGVGGEASKECSSGNSQREDNIGWAKSPGKINACKVEKSISSGNINQLMTKVDFLQFVSLTLKKRLNLPDLFLTYSYRLALPVCGKSHLIVLK